MSHTELTRLSYGGRSSSQYCAERDRGVRVKGGKCGVQVHVRFIAVLHGNQLTIEIALQATVVTNLAAVSGLGIVCLCGRVQHLRLSIVLCRITCSALPTRSIGLTCTPIRPLALETEREG